MERERERERERGGGGGGQHIEVIEILWRQFSLLLSLSVSVSLSVSLCLSLSLALSLSVSLSVSLFLSFSLSLSLSLSLSIPLDLSPHSPTLSSIIFLYFRLMMTITLFLPRCILNSFQIISCVHAEKALAMGERDFRASLFSAIYFRLETTFCPYHIL